MIAYRLLLIAFLVISGSNVGNLFSNPNFLNINNAIGLDDCWMSPDDGLSLLISSNVINRGVNNNLQLIDINQQQRISGAAVDIGPYEYQLLDSVIWNGNVNT